MHRTMKKILGYIAIALFATALLSSCGIRKDNCPGFAPVQTEMDGSIKATNP